MPGAGAGRILVNPMRPSALVVEDDSAIGTLFTVLLNRAGFDVDVISSGSDALTLLSSVRYSAFLFDLMLPGNSGQDLLEFLDKTAPEEMHRVVIVSSAPRKELDGVGQRYSQIRTLRKPFDLEELTEAAIAAAEGAKIAARTVAEEFCRLSIINGAKAGVALIADGDGSHLNVAMSFGYSRAMIEPFVPLAVDAIVPIAVAFRHERAVWLASQSIAAAQYPALASVWEANRSYALAAIPLIRNGKAFGTVGWSFREPRPFSDTERQRFEAIAAFLSRELDARDATAQAS